MKNVLLVLTVLVGSIFLWNYAKQNSIPVKKQIISIPPHTKTQIVPQKSVKQYLFVPYWSIGKSIDATGFDSLIYFGVGVNSFGIEKKDKGYENLPKFIAQIPQISEKILAIRMVDKNINADVLKNTSLQEKIASSSVTLAKKNNFTQILLDYETSAFGFDSTTLNITKFYTLFAKKVHENNLQFDVTLYGDSYFRARPYNIKAIGALSDKVFIMAYDFSKSSGDPGPDFPLTGQEKYGYDMGKMVDDFQKDVSNTKIVVVLGYFGYDWRVDSKGNALASGVPLSTNEITKEFITKCEFKSCNLIRSSETLEPSISYIDDSGENHVVWFEDNISINRKKEFLKTKGILQTAVWAYSYF